MKLKKLYLSILAISVLVVFASATMQQFRVSEEVSYEEVLALVDKKVTNTVRKHSKKFNKPTKIFSRCPSGIMAQVEEIASSKETYSTGTVMIYQGCDGDMVCDYRARLSDETVEIMDQEKKEYISAAAWLIEFKKDPQKYLQEQNKKDKRLEEKRIEEKEEVLPPADKT